MRNLKPAAVVFGLVGAWGMGYQSSADGTAQWYGTITLEGVEYGEPIGACCHEYWGNGLICEMLTDHVCGDYQGTWYGPNVPCNDPQVECDAPSDLQGACCYDDPDSFGFVCTYVTEAQCNGLPDGYWYGPGVPCTDPQVECDSSPGIGACCYEIDNGIFHCREMPEAKCELIGGTWYGAGVLCSDPQVDCEHGACCYDDPDLGGIVCTYVTLGQCEGLPSSYWYGAGVLCTDPQVECDLPSGDEGACCYQWNCESHCDVMSQIDCEEYWGSTFFPNTTCDAVSCPPASDEEGACCYQDAAGGWICDETPVWTCEDLGGSWHPGIPCDCIDCGGGNKPGACCYDDPDLGWICTEVVLAQCEDLPSSVWYGAGVPCSAPNVECDLPGGDDCSVQPGDNCAGRPEFNAPEFDVFGDGQIAVQTGSPSILGGYVVTVFDLSGVDAAPLDSWWSLNRYSDPDWKQGTLGSIFGLALNGDGDIFVTTTRSWTTDLTGSGGWGAVYKLDRVTGNVSVFATLPNSDSGLGNITWDCVHEVFFVSNIEDGRIYRLNSNGTILDWFDHGSPWNGQAGPAALGDRAWAVEAHAGRLYYSMWNEDLQNVSASIANEIWSVELDGMGMPIGIERLEVSTPELQDGMSAPVSDIRFSPNGTMLLAERSMVGWDNVGAHNSRVLEYQCQDGAWIPGPGIFEIGSIPNSATGGVDADVHRTWASGDALHIGAPAPYYNIYGFQGLPSTGGSVSDSVIVDYQDNWNSQDKFMLGDLVVTAYEEGCPGDLDGDEAVDIDDLLVVIGGWGGDDGDVDGDGVTDIEDLLLLLAGFGPCT